MTTSPHPLERLVQQDTFAEMLALLRPDELVVAALRLEGLSDAQIGSLLGVGRSAVCTCMEHARDRIVAELPELARVLRGRERVCRGVTAPATPPLELGWLCNWEDDEEEGS